MKTFPGFRGVRFGGVTKRLRGRAADADHGGIGMKIRNIGLVIVLLAALVAASPALAGAKLKVND